MIKYKVIRSYGKIRCFWCNYSRQIILNDMALDMEISLHVCLPACAAAYSGSPLMTAKSSL